MQIFEPQLNFSPDKPFYQLVMSYISNFYGIHYLISHGLFLRFEDFCKQPKNLHLSEEEQILRFSQSCGEKDQKAVENVLRSGKMEFFMIPSLGSKTSTELKINKDPIAHEIFHDPYSTIQYINRISASGLLILAWENTKEDHKPEPLWEFLRHCRNAAAHKGYFHFRNKEPKKPAKWKALEITENLHNYPLFPVPINKDTHNNPKDYFLGVGDVLYLLSDIEKEFYTKITSSM